MIDCCLLFVSRIFRTKIDIGMKNVSSARCVKLHWLINLSAVKTINCIVANATINNLLLVAISVIKYLSQVKTHSIVVEYRLNRLFKYLIDIERHEKTRISWTTIS